MRSVQKGLIAAGVGMAVNIVLAIVKIVTGVQGKASPGLSPGLTVRSLGDLDDGPLRAVVAARGDSARSGIVASECCGAAAPPGCETVKGALHSPGHFPVRQFAWQSIVFWQSWAPLGSEAWDTQLEALEFDGVGRATGAGGHDCIGELTQ